MHAIGMKTVVPTTPNLVAISLLPVDTGKKKFALMVGRGIKGKYEA